MEDDLTTLKVSNDSSSLLTDKQLDLIYELSHKIDENLSIQSNNSIKNAVKNCPKVETALPKIETSHDFFEWYAISELELTKANSVNSEKFYEKLLAQKQHSIYLLENVDKALSEMGNLTVSYSDVLAKTDSLNEISEQLIIDQNNLQSLSKNISEKIKYFVALNKMSQVLAMPNLSVANENFYEIMNQIDVCMQYLTDNSNYKESYSYLLKYKQHLYTIIFLIKNYVQNIFVSATENAVNAKTAVETESRENVDVTNDKPLSDRQRQSVVLSDVAFSLYYGKFQTVAVKIKPVLEQIEKRVTANNDYAQLLTECQQTYFSQRLSLLNTAIASTMTQLVDSNKGDNCTLFRSASTFMYHICQDEIQLYHYFFTEDSILLNWYLDKLCSHLYDSLRPLIVHINHMETLAELCGILRNEITISDTENSYTRILFQLLQDVQERLVFRTHVYLQTDLFQYSPSAGDLAYPEKLYMMESIALEQSQMPENLTQIRHRTGNSPADLHGMWYPTVKRTLVCLSRLYRCVDRPIFQGLSQEALTICVQSVQNASQLITAKKSPIDGELFQIKHLLILREQIAPFQVDFTVKEMSLDFSKVKTAAFSLLQKRSRMFSLNANNALLEFLLEGTPQVKEQLLDSRKEVDKQLKFSCEKFISYCSDILVGPLNSFLEKANQIQNTPDLTKQNFAKPEIISEIVKTSLKNIKTRLSNIQRSMQLYLANKETEFILFRPIKNNVVTSFVTLLHILNTAGFNSDDTLMIACPSAEQISVILSSASLINSVPTPQQ